MRKMEEIMSLTGSFGSSAAPESDRSMWVIMSAGAVVHVTLIEYGCVLLL